MTLDEMNLSCWTQFLSSIHIYQQLASPPEVDSPVVPIDEREPEQLLRYQPHLPVQRAGKLHDCPLDGVGDVDGAVAVVEPEHYLGVVVKVGEAVAQILGGISLTFRLRELDRGAKYQREMWFWFEDEPFGINFDIWNIWHSLNHLLSTEPAIVIRCIVNHNAEDQF